MSIKKNSFLGVCFQEDGVDIVFLIFPAKYSLESPGHSIYGDYTLNKQENSERWREGGPDRDVWTQRMTWR